MPKYQYSALDHKGEEKTGTIDALSEQDALNKVRALGLYPKQIVVEGKGSIKPSASAAKGKKKKAKTAVGGKVKPKILMIFTRQLATLIDAGLPLLRSLTVLGKQEPNPVLRATINAIADSVQGGSTFSEALAQHPKMFNKLFVNMVKAGELGGVLEVVLLRLAEYQEKAQKLKNKIRSAMVYPCIVLFIAVGIMVFLLLVIVPKFQSMFTDMGIELPTISKIVFGLSSWFFQAPLFIPNAVLLFGGIFLAYVAFLAYGRTPKGRVNVDKAVLKVPLIGEIQSRSAIARFSRTLGTLVTSGVPILQALNITKETAGNVVISAAIGKVHDSVKEGESIVTPMNAATNIFPAMVISMVDVGEETGQLPDMLLKVADVYDDEVDNAVTGLTSMLEPMMIVFLAVVVGGIVFAMFMPLLEVIQKMQ